MGTRSTGPLTLSWRLWVETPPLTWAQRESGNTVRICPHGAPVTFPVPPEGLMQEQRLTGWGFRRHNGSRSGAPFARGEGLLLHCVAQHPLFRVLTVCLRCGVGGCFPRGNCFKSTPASFTSRREGLGCEVCGTDGTGCGAFWSLPQSLGKQNC